MVLLDFIVCFIGCLTYTQTQKIEFTLNTGEEKIQYTNEIEMKCTNKKNVSKARQKKK